MTCVWIGLIAALKSNKLIKTIPPEQFLRILKTQNKKTKTVCNGIKLTTKQKSENMLCIKSIKHIHNGYLMSTCDPVLLLVSDLYTINITHNYNRTVIKYEHPKAKDTIVVHSSTSHFWFDRQT